DGADCPNRIPASGSGQASALDPVKGRSLLLGFGLFRIFLPVPAGADYTLSITPQNDPTTCNTTPTYAQDPANPATRIVSVYRRPLISANLAFATGTEFPPADRWRRDRCWNWRSGRPR
ncbi:MAG TPA: hypothetical protein VGC63_00655, partial [Solirubrobacterales bacterium]